MKNNESVMYSTEVSSIELNYKDDNSSCNKQFSPNIPKISDIITNEEEEDCSSPKLSSQESMDKKFTNLERDLQQLLENIDEMFKSLAIEDSAIDPSIVSGVSEIIDSFICSSDTLSEVND
ncbi:hypothetical protein Anas_10233 [Armadillidium nasatum]|uniref:Uncharacterized protein n=1 Tax=Armadillidium nasatum TaxID=96803 RepID=A0A5N5TP48_9CRUS|nr:hypothetical protein Anas_10233 [Armadillidium nasatum]